MSDKFLAPPAHRFDASSPYRTPARPAAAVEAPLTPEQAAAIAAYDTPRPSTPAPSNFPRMRVATPVARLAMRVPCGRAVAGEDVAAHARTTRKTT